MSPASVHWDHEKSLLLISKFKSHEALWNSNNKDFHNTQKKEEGWWAVAEEMKVPVEELRKKIECLRGSYRRERSKVRSSREKEEEYLPKWFAYKSLAFLEETKSQAISDNGHSCDPEDVSVPKIISRPSVQYVFNEGSENSNNESVLSPIKRKFCSTTDQYRPIRAMSESKKQKRFLVNEPMKKDDVNDSSNIADHVETVSMDGAGLPNRMQEDMSERGVVQPSECLRTKKADRSIGIGCLIDKPSKNEKVTSVPVIARATFKPTKPKPAFEKEQPVALNVKPHPWTPPLDGDRFSGGRHSVGTISSAGGTYLQTLSGDSTAVYEESETFAMSFTVEEDKQIIDFVKKHECIYNYKCKDYRNIQLKKKLWNEIGKILSRTDDECSKRWMYIRDYHVKRRGKPGTISGDRAKRRSKLLSFLDGVPNPKRRTMSFDEDELSSEAIDEPDAFVEDAAESTGQSVQSGEEDHDEESICKQRLPSSLSQHREDLFLLETSPNGKGKPSFPDESSELLLKRVPERSSEVLLDETDHFFISMAKTVKQLPKKDQIRLRMAIGNLVGNAELAVLSRKLPRHPT